MPEKLESKDIEARVQKIEQEIQDLHYLLLQTKQTAWISEIPCQDCHVSLHGGDIAFMIGKSF